MKCHYVQTGETARGIEYVCSNLKCGHKRTSKLPPEKLHRQCDGIDTKLNKKIAAVKQHGAERSDHEIAFIIASYCSFCPHWDPTAAKKKCRFCSCGATDTIEHLHRRRVADCPKPNVPATWSEESIRRQLEPPCVPQQLPDLATD